MRIEQTQVEAFTIHDAKALDPVLVVMEEPRLGVGRVVLTCYGDAWTAYWGAMGERTLKQFLCGCELDYLLPKFKRVTGTTTKNEAAYLSRVIAAMQDALALEAAQALELS